MAALWATARVDEIKIPGTGFRPQLVRSVVVDVSSASRQVEMSLTETGPVEGDASDLLPLLLRRLAGLDVSTLVDLLVLMAVAYEHSADRGIVGINVSEDADVDARVTWVDLGRRRGWSTLDTRGRRRRLHQSVDDLTSIRFTFDPCVASGHTLVNVPLLTRLADVARHGRQRGMVLQFNPLLWGQVYREQRATLYDRRILQVGVRNREWPLRVYLYLTGQWSRGWDTLGQAGTGEGRLKLRLGTVLDGASLAYQDQLTRKGPKWLRGQIRKVLAWLSQEQFIGHGRLSTRSKVLDDLVEVAPPAPMVAELSAYRPRALARKARRKGVAEKHYPHRE